MFILKTIFAFFVLYQVVSTHPTTNDITPYAFESKINETLELLRGILKNGYPEKGIPPLDPFKLEHFEKSVDIDKVITAALSLDNVSFIGAGDFQVTNLKLSVISLKLTFEAILPRMELTGLYKTNGVLMQFIELLGDGEFGTFIDNLKISGSGTVQLSGGIGIKSLNLNISFGNVRFAMTGLMNNEEFTESLVETINELVTPILNDFEKEISAAVSALILDLINGFLKPKEF